MKITKTIHLARIMPPRVSRRTLRSACAYRRRWVTAEACFTNDGFWCILLFIHQIGDKGFSRKWLKRYKYLAPFGLRKVPEWYVILVILLAGASPPFPISLKIGTSLLYGLSQKRWVSEHCEHCSTDVWVDEIWDNCSVNLPAQNTSHISRQLLGSYISFLKPVVKLLTI
jgi:hypothetical protein